MRGKVLRRPRSPRRVRVSQVTGTRRLRGARGGEVREGQDVHEE